MFTGSIAFTLFRILDKNLILNLYFMFCEASNMMGPLGLFMPLPTCWPEECFQLFACVCARFVSMMFLELNITFALNFYG